LQGGPPRTLLAAAVSHLELRLTLSGHKDGVTSPAFSPDGTRIVTASADKTARIWDAATGKEIAVLRGHEKGVTSAIFSPDGTRLVTASDDKTARIWDAVTGQQVAVLRGHEASVRSAAFSPDGGHILTWSSDTTVRIWAASTAEEIKQIAVLGGNKGAVRSAAFSPDGMRIVTASVVTDRYGITQVGLARIWDVTTGEHILDIGMTLTDIYSAVFSPDGKPIVTASEGFPQVSLWDAATGKAIAKLGGDDTVTFAGFSPDGTRVVTASSVSSVGKVSVPVSHVLGGTATVIVSGVTPARILDAHTGKETAVLRGHERYVNSAAFNFDGTRIVTASADGTARIWDVATGSEIAVVPWHEGPKSSAVTSAAFSPDGTRIVTASVDDKTARVWDVHFATMSTRDLVAEVCTRRLRDFTTMSLEEMRLAGYPNITPPIDVCAGVQ